jgi:uncharacterized protein (DUF4415 family)
MPRGKGKKEAMTHVNLRLPNAVLDYFKQFPNFTVKMRDVLREHAGQYDTTRMRELREILRDHFRENGPDKLNDVLKVYVRKTDMTDNEIQEILSQTFP